MYEKQQDVRPFKLSDEFLIPYKTQRPDFGFNGLGELTYKRTYARILPDGTKEDWWQTIRRVIEGVYTMQKKWIVLNNLGWDNRKAQASAQEMYDRMFTMKFLPSGRGLWAWGSPITEERGLYMALNSCAMVTTENIRDNPSEPFCFLMDASMLGVGVGFDTRGAGKVIVNQPKPNPDNVYQITDDREGWVISIEKLINSYLLPNQDEVYFNYSLIRPEGSPINGFGGISAGYQGLEKLHEQVRETLNKNIGKKITVRTIADIMNMIGACVVSGNVRRTALISFGEPEDDEFLNLKNYKLNPDRSEYGWTSNNSVFAKIGMDYSAIAERIKDNGEPGVLWLENARAYSRMCDAPDWKDRRVIGANPCLIYATPILTNNGYVEIGKLDGEQVILIDENGKQQNSKVFKSGTKNTIKLTLSNHQEIICTPDHIFKTTEGKSISAENTEGVKLMPFLHLPYLDKKYILFGFLQGDGALGRLKSKRHFGVEAIIGKNDSDIWDLIKDRKYTTTNRGAYIQDIKDELIALGFDSNVLPERDFPETYKTWDINKKASFLCGCFSANGCAQSSGRITYKATNKLFIDSLKKTLKDDFGIDSYITTNKPKIVKFSNGEYLLKESYDLNIAKFEDKVKFYNSINFYQKYKKEILKNNLISKAPYVRSIKPHGIVDVYDFSMENNHWGVINGFIAHNCNEQSLENQENCLLVETFPNKNVDLDDYKRTLKFAYLYAKTVTLAKTHWENTNRVMLRNRRIGLSMSGLAQFITNRGLDELKRWCTEGYQVIKYYDEVYSDWLAIPKSIKVTTVKPSGTVSLLAGATPGIHYPESQYYIRRVRLSKYSDLIEPLKKAGYKMESAIGQEDSTLVVEFPVTVGDNIRTVKDVSMWEQLALGAFMQKYWSDNQVSQTVTFDPDTEAKDIANALNLYQYQLKGVSFLPRVKEGAYPQMPYESITKEQYEEMVSHLKPLDFSSSTEDGIGEKYCSNDVCLVE